MKHLRKTGQTLGVIQLLLLYPCSSAAKCGILRLGDSSIAEAALYTPFHGSETLKGWM